MIIKTKCDTNETLFIHYYKLKKSLLKNNIIYERAVYFLD